MKIGCPNTVCEWTKTQVHPICELIEETSVSMIKALTTELLFTPTPKYQANPGVNRHRETQTAQCRL